MNNALSFRKIGKGPAFVMIHGWGWNAAIWEPIVPSLAEHFTLYLIDLPGSGHSPMCVTDYTFAAIAPLILDCVPDKAYWCGWSLGGMLTWYIARQFPNRVTRFITIASSPRFIADGSWPGVAAATLEKFGVALSQNVEKTLLDFLELQLRGSANAKLLFTALQNAIINPKPTMEALQGGLHLLQTEDLRNSLQSIPAESLHLFGDRDRLVPTAVATLLTRGKTQVITNSGHIPFLSQPDDFLAAVINFCQ